MATKNAASEKVMGGLHKALAEALIEQLEGEPILDEDMNIIGRKLDPRWATAAITFLNNNKVTMNPEIVSALTEIEEKLNKRTKRFANVKKDAAEAARKYAANE